MVRDSYSHAANQHWHEYFFGI